QPSVPCCSQIPYTTLFRSSVVRKVFEEKYQVSPKSATDFYYHFSQATNYIRTDRIVKDEKWTTDTEFGQMDITINLSKPEKDPRSEEHTSELQSRFDLVCR